MWRTGTTSPAGAAAPLAEVVPLGQSGSNGSICEAIRDYPDPLGQGSQAKAWRLRCRGYTTVLGRIYQLPMNQKAAWQTTLAARAKCSAQAAGPGGLPGKMSTCKLTQGAVPYVVFVSESGSTLTVAEGLAPLADVIETGLKVAPGLTTPPNITAVQTSAAQAEIAADFPNMSGLAAAEAASTVDPMRLRSRGYVQNNEWKFDEAETVFRALVNDGDARNAPAAQRGDALLNLAMNISNNGRFDEAEGYFTEANALIPGDDLLLRARSLNYRALHERNRGQFAKAIASAREALQLRAASGQMVAGRAGRGAAANTAGSTLVIDQGLERRLNTPSAAQSLIESSAVTVAEQLDIQDAQAWQVIGTSQMALGQAADARISLDRAREILLRGVTVGRSMAWLQARVEADIANLDLRDGRSAEAVTRYAAAIRILRTRHADSSAEAAMLLDLGRAETALGRDAGALATYARAMTIFRSQRGGLGASADQAAPYFDLLLKSIKSDPAKANTYGVLLTSSTVKPDAVDMRRADVKAAVLHLRKPLEPQEQLVAFDAAASARLFDALFGPVKSEVLAAGHLIYEPERPLVSLPVSLFVADAASVRTDAKGEADYIRAAWLGVRVSSSLAVSGASFLQSRAFAPSQARQPYLGFGDPSLPRGEARAFTPVTRSILRRSAVLERICGETRNALLQIEALPETALEVQQIGESLGTLLSTVTGTAFSDDAIRSRNDLADYRVLYFATHGLLPQPDACVPEPALVTSLGGGDSDALLDSSEILNLKLDTDLVVLAACDTGGGGASVDRTGLTGGGEALGGLTRAMIYAGSRALVVSHWSIESESAARLMTGFFGAKAPTMARSLQASQVALQRDPKYAHPYFWAPFTLVGDGDRALPGAGQPRVVA